MPKLTIDGKEIEVPQGTRLIEAAKGMDENVPYYCYHPGLSIAGNCRMCLVEIEKMPKLQIACHMQCQDGMVVHTKNEKVLKTRQHILEFLLVNHPLDCPVCDQAGECWLQDYYMKHGLYDSRVVENKVKKEKATSIGPTVMLDQERCILCSRCVRFTDEISKTNELGITERGDHSEICTFPGKELDNPYAGNVVDICPVGALTDKDFRFKTRVWYLKTGDSLCNGCSRGCNIQVQYNLDRPHKAGGDRIIRLKPRFSEDVNKWWMCDEGRYGYHQHNKNRILKPQRLVKGSQQEISWEVLLPELCNNIEAAKGNVGVLVSPQLSNETLFLIREFLRDKLRLKDFHLVKANPDGFEDGFLIRADKNPNAKGAEFLGFQYDDVSLAEFGKRCASGQVEGLIILGQDILKNQSQHFTKSVFENTKWSAFFGSNTNLTSESATYVLAAATYVEEEGTFANFEGRIQKFNKIVEPLGDSKPIWDILVQMARQMQVPVTYESEEEIFDILAGQEPTFKDLDYEKLRTSGSDIRKIAAPTVPVLQQEIDIL